MTDTSLPPEDSLTEDALTSADTSLARQMAQATKRPRGRPLGSKNKSTIEREASMVNRFTTPPSRGSTAGKTTTETHVLDERELRERRQAKANRAQVYAAKISVELNDHMMTMLVAMGVPTEMVYAPGKAPIQEQHYAKYGPVGNAMAVDPATAKSWGQFLADLTDTQTGSKVANITDNPNAAILLHGVLAAVSTFQWFNGARKMMEQLGPVLEAYKRQQANDAQAQANAEAQQNGAQ